MTTPEATPADVAEQRQSPTGAPVPDAALPDAVAPAADVPAADAAPEADILEQAQPADLPEHDTPGPVRGDFPLEADPADAAEQEVDVPFDEDEQR